MHWHTAFIFFFSYRSTVEKTSFSRTPNLRHACMKALTFSICLKGMTEVLILGQIPDCSVLATLHKSCPSCSQSARSSSPLFSPDTSSSQSRTAASRSTAPEARLPLADGGLLDTSGLPATCGLPAPVGAALGFEGVDTSAALAGVEGALLSCVGLTGERSAASSARAGAGAATGAVIRGDTLGATGVGAGTVTDAGAAAAGDFSGATAGTSPGSTPAMRLLRWPARTSTLMSCRKPMSCVTTDFLRAVSETAPVCATPK
mmetsp:Transcript_85944/g.199820  ORF Transcript_85944/g.199820 Transcript_85944/m.199820 type:complete len:260 (-) Transcript_85944:408-1187(-)